MEKIVLQLEKKKLLHVTTSTARHLTANGAIKPLNAVITRRNGIVDVIQ